MTVHAAKGLSSGMFSLSGWKRTCFPPPCRKTIRERWRKNAASSTSPLLVRKENCVLHLRINILIIYIYRLNSFPCTFLLNRHRQRYDWYEKNPFFRIRKSGLLPPELRGLTRRSPLLRTQKSLVSRFTQILYDCPHLQGESTSSFLSSNRFPVALSLAPGLPLPIWTTVSLPIPTSNPKDRKRPPIPDHPPVTPDFEFIHHHNPHRFIAP